MLNQAGWRGDVTVTVNGPAGPQVWHGRNLITNGGLDLLVASLAGTDAEIKYVAVGSDATAPTVDDTVLGAEEFRKQVTAQTTIGTGIVNTSCVILPAEATGFTIAEIGWFAGADATASADSGVLIARVLYSKTKTNLESLQIDRADVLTRSVGSAVVEIDGGTA